MLRFLKALKDGLLDYARHLWAFRPNARLYLLNVIIVGASMGVFRLLFNFYVLSLGFDEELLGNLVTTSSLTALFAALPMGYLITGRIGTGKTYLVECFAGDAGVPCVELKNGRLVGKAFDDRAAVGAMVVCLELLRQGFALLGGEALHLGHLLAEIL